MKLIIILIILIILVQYHEEVRYYTELMTSSFSVINVDILNNNFKNKYKICIISLDDRNDEYITLHKKSLQNYCTLHGYTYIFDKPCNNLPIYFCKFQTILELMNKNQFDYYIWIDSDTIINKKFLSFPLESMIEQIGTDVDLTTTCMDIPLINPLIGAFYMFKNTQDSRDLLKRCIDYIDKAKWENMRKGDCVYAGSCYEEAGLFYSLNDITHKRIKGNFLYHCKNCRSDPNHFIIHNMDKDAKYFLENS